MGIYFRYTAAFIILCIFSLNATATVRVNANSKAKDIISKPLEAGFSTPNGASAYYGRDKMFDIDNRVNASGGDSVGPTIREVKPSTVGNVSFPYGPNAAYPNGSGVNNPVLKVREKVRVPKANIKNALKTGLKSNLGSIILGAAVTTAVGAVGWVMTEGTLTKKNTKQKVSSFNCMNFLGEKVGETALDGPADACIPSMLSSIQSRYPLAAVTGINLTFGGPNIEVLGTGVPNGRIGFTTGNAPVNNPDFGKQTPVVEADFDLLDPWLNQQSADWLGGLIREVCDGSTAPDQCYDQMKEGGGFDISGPSTVQGPVSTKTTTTTNADGTTSTRTDTTSTKFDITYNNNNNTFDVDTKITNTTTVDGQVTETSEQTDDTPAIDPTPEEETPEENYKFDDAGFPTVEPFYEQKYPDGLPGVWQSISTQIDNSEFIQFLQGFVPNFSGSCPAFGLDLNIASWASYGNRSFGSICYVLDFVKIILLVTALFTFRKITFGG